MWDEPSSIAHEPPGIPGRFIGESFELLGDEPADGGSASHGLRHTAATEMLRHGVSLDHIGLVLRHRSLDMSAYYAKVDITTLRQVAQPWPGRRS